MAVNVNVTATVRAYMYNTYLTRVVANFNGNSVERPNTIFGPTKTKAGGF